MLELTLVVTPDVSNTSLLIYIVPNKLERCLQRFCALLDLPQPVSKNVFTQDLKTITEELIDHAQGNLMKAWIEHYEATSDDDVDILVSCDGTWQKRGFTSLFGAAFIVSFESGKMFDYRMLSGRRETRSSRVPRQL